MLHFLKMWEILNPFVYQESAARANSHNRYWNPESAAELPDLPVLPALLSIREDCRRCWMTNDDWKVRAAEVGRRSSIVDRYTSLANGTGSARLLLPTTGAGAINGSRISTISPPSGRLKAVTFPP